MAKMSPEVYFIVLIAFVVVVLYFERSAIRQHISTRDFDVYSAPKDVLVSIPKNPAPGQENSAIVIIGGMYGSGPRWIIDEIPYDIRQTRNIILGEYFYSVEDTLNMGTQLLKSKGIGLDGLDFTSISGFSAGGSQLMNSYEPHTFPRVFLIDPSATKAQSYKDFEGEVVFLYGWDVHEDVYESEYREIIEEVLDADGIVDEVEIDHYEFPNYTFNKYKKYL